MMRTGTTFQRRANQPRTSGALSLPLFLAVCSALILAACGGDDGGKPSASASVSPSRSATASVGPSQSASNASPATTAPAGTGAGDVACSLITKQEAEQALGEPLGEPQSGALGDTTSCGYQPSPDRGVLISVTKGVSKADFETRAKQSAELFHTQAQPVAGVGDEAFWLEPYLLVLKNGVFYRISVWAPQISAPDQLERAKGLALKAAGRIP